MPEPKRLALIRILEIFYKHSDFDHPLMQEDIVNLLRSDYDIDIERKAVGRCVSLLREAGFEIISSRNGSYLCNKVLEDSELRLIIDGVLSSKHITEKHSRELIEKLCGLTSDYFRLRVKNIYSVGDWSKTENRTLFYNIDLIDEAIVKKRLLNFDYNRYGIDKKLYKSSEHTVSPFQLIVHNQRYYLFAYDENRADIVFYRTDKITNICITDIPSRNLRTVNGYENGIDYSKFSSAFPYMYADKIETVDFIADIRIVDQIVDWFGYGADISKSGEDKVRVSVRVSLKAMEYWAMQYCNYVWILFPIRLREKVAENLGRATAMYENN